MALFVGEQWIFVHVPKTAGTSITRTLLTNPGVSRIPGRKHMPCRTLRENYPGVRCFGFVRNPWDRIVSLFSFIKDGGVKSYDFGDRQLALKRGFKAWLLEGSFVAPERAGWGGRPVQRQPQLFWLKGCSFVGRYERLQKDFDQACRLIGVPSARLPRNNTSVHPPYQELYDDETREAVAKWFAADIERWGYRF